MRRVVSGSVGRGAVVKEELPGCLGASPQPRRLVRGLPGAEQVAGVYEDHFGNACGATEDMAHARGGKR